MQEDISDFGTNKLNDFETYFNVDSGHIEQTRFKPEIKRLIFRDKYNNFIHIITN